MPINPTTWPARAGLCFDRRLLSSWLGSFSDVVIHRVPRIEEVEKIGLRQAREIVWSWTLSSRKSNTYN